MKKPFFNYKLGTLILLTLVFAIGFYSCGANNSTPDNVEFSLTSSVDSVGDSQGTIILDTVKILISDIKLNVTNSNQDSTNFKTGPFVLFLDLNSNVTAITSAMIPSGTYSKIKFYVHKLNNNEPVPDPEFTDSNGRYSVIAKGTYLGKHFIYKSSKSAHQILSFPNSIQITSANLSSNITLKVSPYVWFIENGVYLDPQDPSNANYIDNSIKENINNNFKAFKDNDRNGISD